LHLQLLYSEYCYHLQIRASFSPYDGGTARRNSERILALACSKLDGALVGYAYANKWKLRTAYRYSVETTMYLEHGRQGLGIGKRLYSELLSLLRAKGIHVTIGGSGPSE